MSGETISHDVDAHRYSLVVDGTEAYLTYERPSPGRIHITHTIVPDNIGGRGLGTASCWTARPASARTM